MGEASGGIPEFETRNLAYKLAGTSEERRKYYPQFGQQYFDTDLGNERDLTQETRARRIRAPVVAAPVCLFAVLWVFCYNTRHRE